MQTVPYYTVVELDPVISKMSYVEIDRRLHIFLYQHIVFHNTLVGIES